MKIFIFAFLIAIIPDPIIGPSVNDHMGLNTLWFSIGFLGIFILHGYQIINYIIQKREKREIF
jgi:hypothetical protein